MKRSDFLKSMLGIGALAQMPVEFSKVYQKIYLLQCFVRGFQYYEGPKLIKSLNETKNLTLVREPDNEHDKYAIALYFENQKIGYIPRETNKILSRMIDADLIKIHVEITHLEPKAATWENVRVAVYVLKDIVEAGNHLPEELITIKEPFYKTIEKTNNGNSESEDVNLHIKNQPHHHSKSYLIYDLIVANSASDSIYNSLHNIDSKEFEKAVEQNRIVINFNSNEEDDCKSKNSEIDLTKSVKEIDELLSNKGKIVQKFNEVENFTDCIEKHKKSIIKQVKNIDNKTNLDGYVTAKVETLSNLPGKIDSIQEIVTESGIKLYELTLK